MTLTAQETAPGIATTAQGRKPLTQAQHGVIRELEKGGWTAERMLADSMLMTRSRAHNATPAYRLVSIDGKIFD